MESSSWLSLCVLSLYGSVEGELRSYYTVCRVSEKKNDVPLLWKSQVELGLWMIGAADSRARLEVALFAGELGEKTRWREDRYHVHFVYGCIHVRYAIAHHTMHRSIPCPRHTPC